MPNKIVTQKSYSQEQSLRRTQNKQKRCVANPVNVTVNPKEICPIDHTRFDQEYLQNKERQD